MIFKNLLDRNVLLLFTARTMSSFGDGVFFIAISWFVYNINKSTVDLGLFHAVTAIPTLIIIPIIGVWVDKFPRKYIAAAADIIRFLILSLLVVIIILDRFSTWNIYILNIVLSLGEVTYFIAFFGLIPNAIKKESIFECNSLITIGLQSGYLLGASTAGFIISVFEFKGALIIDMVSFLISASCIMLLQLKFTPSDNIKKDPIKAAYLNNIKEGFILLCKDRSILALVMLSTVPYFFINSINIIVPAFVVKNLNSGPLALGLIDSALGIGAIFGALGIQFLNKKGYGNIYFWLGFFLLSIATFVFSFNNHVPGAIIGNFFIGFTYAGIGIVYQSKIQILITDNFLGRINSFRRILMNMLNPLILMLIGYIGVIFSYKYIFIAISMVLLILTIFGSLLKTKVDIREQKLNTVLNPE